jgi:hypothetical protein
VKDMSKDAQNTELAISDCCEALFDITACLLKNVEPKQGHWIAGTDQDGNSYDQSEDWCEDCGKKKVKELKESGNENEGHEYILDGGWENHESDYPTHCEECSCLLNYWPTEDCAKNEIEAFGVLDKITNDMSDEDLYSLSVCCQAAQDFRSEKLRIRLAKVCMKFLRWYSIWGVKSAESAIRKASQ